MKHSYFEWANAVAPPYRNPHYFQNESEAYTYLGQCPPVNSLISTLQIDLKAELQINEKAYSLGELSSKFLSELDPFPIEFQNALKYTIGYTKEPSNHDQIVLQAAWIVAGQAFGQFVSQSHPRKEFMYLQFPSHPRFPDPSYYQEFQIAFAKGINENSNLRGRWIEFFQTYAKECLPDFIGFLHGNKDTTLINERSQKWKLNLDPFKVLNRKFYSNHFSHDRQISGFFELLYHIDATIWLSTIEQFPIPELIVDSLWDIMSNIKEAQFFDLVSKAPLVFDKEGNWKRNCTILVLIQQLTQHISNTHRSLIQIRSSIQSTEAMENLEFFEHKLSHQILEKLVTCLLNREDGKKICHFLLREYVQTCAHSTSNVREATWSLTKTFVDVLANNLGVNRKTIEELYQVWKSHEETAKKENKKIPSVLGDNDLQGIGARSLYTKGLPELLAAIQIWEKQCFMLPDIAEFLWKWFVELLLGYDQDLKDFVSMPNQNGVREISYGCSLLGKLLAQQADPLKVWKETFQTLEPQRHRMRFRSSSWSWSFGSSDILNQVALVACTFLSKNPSFPEKIISIWLGELLESNWFLYVTSSAGGLFRPNFLAYLLIETLTQLSLCNDNDLDQATKKRILEMIQSGFVPRQEKRMPALLSDS